MKNSVVKIQKQKMTWHYKLICKDRIFERTWHDTNSWMHNTIKRKDCISLDTTINPQTYSLLMVYKSWMLSENIGQYMFTFSLETRKMSHIVYLESNPYFIHISLKTTNNVLRKAFYYIIFFGLRISFFFFELKVIV